MPRLTEKSRWLVLALSMGALACRQDMHDQAKVEPLEGLEFFSDGQGSRLPVEGTVARGWLREDSHLYRGLNEQGQFVTAFPMEVDRAMLERGRDRFEIFCTPCHGRTGDGQGMIVQRGFQQPETFHQERLRQAEVGYFFDVMTNGFGQMSSYAPQVSVADRWAIVAYIQALQKSRYTDYGDLSADEREALEGRS